MGKVNVKININRAEKYLQRYGKVIKNNKTLKLRKKTKLNEYFELKLNDSFSCLLTDTKKNSINKRFLSSSVKILTLNLAPYYYNFCPKAGNCQDVCIGIDYHAPKNIIAQIKRSELFINDKEMFFNNLICQLKNETNNVVVRLNNYSDIAWENEKIFKHKYTNNFLQKLSVKSDDNIFSYFPEILFYDYTKIPERFKNYLKGNFPRNYFLTYSYDKKNDKDYQSLINSVNEEMVETLQEDTQKFSIAFIVKSECKKKLLEEKADLEQDYKNIELINGDKDDCRIFDLQNQDRLAKIVLLEYNAKTGIKKNKEDKKYYLKYDEIKEKIEEINKKFKKYTGK